MHSLPTTDTGLESKQARGGGQKNQTLQAVNGRLEEAIHHMRVAKEALQTSKQELSELNGHLEMVNDEVELLSHQVGRLREGYAHMLECLPHPVLLMDKDGRIELWNSAAQRLFTLVTDGSATIELSEIPVQPSLRQQLVKNLHEVVSRGASPTLRNRAVRIKRALHHMDVRFTSLWRDSHGAAVLVMFISSPATDEVAALSSRDEALIDSAVS